MMLPGGTSGPGRVSGGRVSGSEPRAIATVSWPFPMRPFPRIGCPLAPMPAPLPGCRVSVALATWLP